LVRHLCWQLVVFTAVCLSVIGQYGIEKNKFIVYTRGPDPPRRHNHR